MMKHKRREHLGSDPLSRADAPPALLVIGCPVVTISSVVP